MPWEIAGASSLNVVPFPTGGLTYDQAIGTYNDAQGTYADASPQVTTDLLIVGYSLGETSYEDPTINYDEAGFETALFESFIVSKLFSQPRIDRYWHECRVYYDADTTGDLQLYVSINGGDWELHTELEEVEPLVAQFIRTRKVRRGRTYQFKITIDMADTATESEGQIKLTSYEIDYTLAGESKR